MKTKIHPSTKKSVFLHKRNKSLAVVFLVSIIVASCGPEIPDHPGGIVRKKPDGCIANPAAPMEVSVPQPYCPDEGTGCTIPYLQPIRPPHHYSRIYGELKSYAEMKDLQTFFLNNPDWEVVIPGIKNGSEEYYKLIAGQHKLYFYTDSSIAIYDPSVTTDNIIHMYSYNGR